MSEIGALSVRIGADTADLQKGLKDAEKEVSNFSKYVNDVSSDLKVFAATAGVAAAAAAVMGKRAIDAADAFNDLSERTGISTASLSRLEYAARFADLSLGELQQGILGLTRNMSAAQAGTGDAYQAFKALEIQFKNTDGSLRSTESLILDLADRFSTLQNGTDKTALAIQIFGKAGAQMIPFLNMGRDGIKDFADELEYFGGVVTPEAAAQAGIFNDNLDRLKAAAAGAAQQMSQALLPALNEILNGLLAINKVSTEKGFWATFLGLTELGQLLTGDDSVEKRVAEIMKKSQEAQRKAIEEAKAPGEKSAPPIIVSAEQVKKERDLMNEHVIAYLEMQEKIREEQERYRERLSQQAESVRQGLLDERTAIIEDEAEKRKILDEANAMGLMADEAHAQARIALEQQTQDKLNEIRKRGMTELEKFQQMSYGNQVKTVAQSLIQMTQSVTRESRAMFNINKAASIANAIVSTYEGINKALAAYPPPFSFAMAAAQAAAGFANVRAISSQQFGSASAAPSVSASTPVGATAVSPVGGGGGGGGGGGAGQVVTINLTGEIFGREQVRGLIGQINEAISDGAVLRLQ
jgi:hypothetical protein